MPEGHKNIFEVWKSIGEKVPFAVCRDGWSSEYYAVVEGVEIKKWPYGKAFGFAVSNGSPHEHFDYDRRWCEEKIIPCCGCYQWTLVKLSNDQLKRIIADYKLIETLDTTTSIEKPLVARSTLTFGKHSGLSIQEVMEVEPNYIEWCLSNLDRFFLDSSYFDEVKSKFRNIERAQAIDEKRLATNLQK